MGMQFVPFHIATVLDGIDNKLCRYDRLVTKVTSAHAPLKSRKSVKSPVHMYERNISQGLSQERWDVQWFM